ncbi:MAG: DnaJ domain-containing protein [Nannocystaceae bacterium]
MSLSKRLWDLARSNATDFTSAFTARRRDLLDDAPPPADNPHTVGARAGQAARRAKTRAEHAWDQAYEAAKVGRHVNGRPRSNADLARWHETLEIDASVSDIELRRAYRRLINQYHPDRYATDPPKYRAATEVARKLTEAYNGLREHRGL